MMLRNPLLTTSFISSSAPSSESESATILSEFRLENSCYRVILFTRDDPAAPISADETHAVLEALLQSIGIDRFSETERFTVKGQLCIIVETACSDEPPPEAVLKMSSVLTDRELQIAALVALGKVNKQIAKQLHISEWTVATYLRRMFAKLRVDSRAALVYRCAPLIRHFQELAQSAPES